MKPRSAQRLGAYPAGHPVALALAAIGHAINGGTDVVTALDEQARAAGVAPDSEAYDAAAELAGRPYCRALDLYVDRYTKARADALHFSEAHLALSAHNREDTFPWQRTSYASPPAAAGRP